MTDVLSVPEGSIVVLRGFDGADVPVMLEMIRRTCGHDKFLLVVAQGDDDVTVHGAEEIAALIRSALGR